MNNKCIKCLLGLAAVIIVVVGVIYFLKTRDSEINEELSEDFEVQDFDLDHTVKNETTATHDREYVPLNSTPSSESKENPEN